MVLSPIHFEFDISPELSGWYFWEETWADRQGPFDTRLKCETALTVYANALDPAPETLQTRYNKLRVFAAHAVEAACEGIQSRHEEYCSSGSGCECLEGQQRWRNEFQEATQS